VAELRPEIPRIHEAGADLAVVGTGAPGFARALRDELGLGDVPVLSDETRRAFQLAGFRRGWIPLLRPRALWKYLRAFLAGYGPRQVQGDALQQGGILIILPGGAVAFSFRSQASGDTPDYEMILGALREHERASAGGT
jgi:hypothetical protein